MRECDLYRPLKGDTVQCLACHHWCAIKPNGYGKCGVRRNFWGKLYLITYGKAAAVNIDPVEKKPLYHFLPGEGILSIGTLGCNFSCQFCQNWEISQMKDFNFNPETGESDKFLGYYWPPERIVETAEDYGVRLIAFTYNEPVVWIEYAHDVAELSVKMGMRNVFVSSGFETHSSWEYMDGLLHAVNIDLKGFSEKFYREIIGARLKPVLKNIEYLGGEIWPKIWIEITTLVIEGYNDSEKELRGISRFIASINKSIPWHITAAHPDYKMLHIKHTSHRTLIKAYEIGKEEGLNFVYVGNIYDPERSSTYCPNCGELLILREWYRVKEYWKERGKCHKCGTEIPGVWE